VTYGLPDLLAAPGVATVFGLLNREGEEGRIVGGAVRDALLGRMPHEVDFATTALPDEVVRRAGAARLKSVPTGLAHGTVTVIVEGQPFEITTLRRDVDTDGRHAVVAFGRDWQEDAHRRDFTINGMFLDAAGQVHDHVGGTADIAARRVRFIGDARTRIREDYLRILRYFRFFAGYSDGLPDPEAWHGAICERDGLARLSRERVRHELLRLLTARRAPEALALMAEAGLAGRLVGGVVRVPHLARLAAIEQALGTPPDAVLRLGALALFVKEDAVRMRERLRLSTADGIRLERMAGRVPALHPHLTEADRVAALYRLGPQAFHDRVLLAWARQGAEGDDPSWRELLRDRDQEVPVFPVAGRDLIAWGVPAGPELGRRLRALEEAWAASGFPDAGWVRARFDAGL
jgi:tRNA nucleotidyltransferase/poly(A) polymerase